MAITDIEISEELMTNAPSIKYSGDEGPKSPQEIEAMMMADAVLQEEYEKYVFDLLEIRPEATPMTLEEFRQMVIAEGLMSGGQPLPEDPTKPVNPFAPKPVGPVLPDRQMAAYGGIMGMDGRKQYGIGSFFQKAKDKFIDDIIPNEIKENPLAAATAAAYGIDTFGIPGTSIGGNKVTNTFLNDLFTRAKNKIMPGTSEVFSEEEIEKGITKDGRIIDKSVYGVKEPGFLSKAANFALDLSPNTLATIGGGLAGLFTKNTESNTPGVPSDDTAMNIRDLAKTANVLDQKQGMAAGLNFLPSVAARKYSPAEMANTYAQAANGGRIGMAEGGIMDLGGMEKDFRNTGGFVDIGAKEKADDVPARLSVNEFVMTADAVRGMGDGDIDLGAKRMENLMGAMENKKGAQQMFDVSERLSEVV